MTSIQDLTCHGVGVVPACVGGFVFECEYCGAKLLKSERGCAKICCSNGKVKLPLYDIPEEPAADDVAADAAPDVAEVAVAPRPPPLRALANAVADLLAPLRALARALRSLGRRFGRPHRTRVAADDGADC